MVEKRLGVLFSGGVHSSLAVALSALKYNRITCLVMKRFGLFGEGQVKKRLEALQARFPRVEFDLQVLSIDRHYQDLLKGDRFNIMSLSACGLCKLAMHWRAISYCMENKINAVCDGSESSMIQYPDQNESIMLGNIRKMYLQFGIDFFTPVFNLGDKAEYNLFRMGVIGKRQIRGTKDDLQVICTQQRIFKLFVDYYVMHNGWDRYIEDSRVFFDRKIEIVKKRILENNK